MKKIEYSKDYKTSYPQIFSQLEFDNIQREWKNARTQYIELTVFPFELEKILTADFEQLTDWYFDYKKIITQKPVIEKKFIQRVKGKKSKLLIFDYNKYYPKIIKYFYQNTSKMNMHSCFYCDIQPIGKYSKKKTQPRLTIDLDHFYPKDQCPILALSLKNFIPSCSTCNSRIKGKTNFIKFYDLDGLSDQVQKDYFIRLAPSSDKYNFIEKACFFVYPKTGFTKKINSLDNIKSYKIAIDTDEIYEKEIKELFKNSSFRITEEQIEEIIFRKKIDEKKHTNLLKLKNDILE